VLTTPIIEGTDGVQKMSKSYGNYIGINEPPQEIYGKVMSISDQLMWRYYEVLTDVTTSAIEQMKVDAASGKQHPMALKKALAKKIVQDFHSAEAAQAAEENWARQFQKDEVPEDLETATIHYASVVLERGDTSNALPIPSEDVKLLSDVTSLQVVRIDKILREAGLAESVADAQRKVKQGAVRIGATKIQEMSRRFPIPASMVVRVGRHLKEVRLVNSPQP
jgi:tyrosyl-tRNA synthetase